MRSRTLQAITMISVAWSCATAAPAAAPEKPTFSRDIAPIIFSNCTACHRPGQVGPFSLTNYDEVKRRAKQIALVTEKRIMPPWLPQSGWGEFKHARTLSEDQIATLRNWAQTGTPEGDAQQTPPLPKFKDGWQLGEPDLILKMPKPFTIPAEGRDVYVHFVFPLNFDKDKYLRGIEVMPGNRKVAHHAVGILDNTGKARQQAAANGGTHYLGNAPGFLPAGFTPGYVPGQQPGFFDEDSGITIKKGTDLVLQMHYHPTGREETDQTTIGLYFTDKAPKRGASIFLMGNLDIDIPPGLKSFKRYDAFKLEVDYEMRSIWAHMHLIGRRVKVWAELPDKSVRKLMWIENWDFNCQDTYVYEKPFVLPKGTIVRAEFEWDNSAENPTNPFNPPQRIVEGEQSTNEMGGLILGGLPVQQDQEWIHWLSVGGHYLAINDKNPSKVQSRRQELERTSQPPSTETADALVPRHPKQPAPDAKARQQAQAKLTQLFKAQYAQTDAAAKLDMASVFQKTSQHEEDAALRYVLLKESIRLASEAGDQGLAYAGIGRLSQAFEVKPLELKEEALKTLTRQARTAQDYSAITASYTSLANEAVAIDQYDMAVTASRTAAAAAGQSKDRSLIASTREHTNDVFTIQREFAKVEPASKTLLTSPNDPAACAAMGRFLCLTKGRWKEGLPLLAKGDDASLKKLADAELKNPSVAAEQLALADGWHEIARGQSGRSQQFIAQHAAEWYSQCVSKLEGVDQLRVEKRLLEALSGQVKVPLFKARFRDGHRYGLIEEFLDWEQAQKRCEELGGHLVTIDGRQENELAVEMNAGLKKHDTFTEPGVWIGLTRKGKPAWQWVTGEPTHYQYWRSGEGTGWFDQSFAGFLLDKDQWDDWHGHAKMRFICEWE